MGIELDRQLVAYDRHAVLSDQVAALADVLGDLLRECTNVDGDVYAPSPQTVESALTVMREFYPGEGW